RHSFVGSAQVFTDERAEVIETAGEQLAGNAPRIVGLAGEEADGLRGANAIQDGVKRMVGQVGQVCFFPAFLDAGKGKLHAADVGQNLEAFLAEAVTEIASDAIKK